MEIAQWVRWRGDLEMEGEVGGPAFRETTGPAHGCWAQAWAEVINVLFKVQAVVHSVGIIKAATRVQVQ